MITTIELALACIKFANFLLGLVEREQLKKSGRDEAIAEMAVMVAKRTKAGKAIMEKIDAMSDDDVDAALRDLAK